MAVEASGSKCEWFERGWCLEAVAWMGAVVKLQGWILLGRVDWCLCETICIASRVRRWGGDEHFCPLFASRPGSWSARRVVNEESHVLALRLIATSGVTMSAMALIPA